MVKYDYVVAQDGSGDFATLQEAVTAAEKQRGRRRILVKAGIYHEKLDVPPGVEVRGEE